MRVGTDDNVARHNQSLFGQKGVLNAHAAYVVKVGHFLFVTEITAHLALHRCLDVLVGRKVVHNHGHLFLVKDLLGTNIVELADGYGRSNVVAQNAVNINKDQLSRLNLVKTCMRRKNLLRHCHSHGDSSFGW